jgi:ABC-type multidrug transport system fused ATPase/permease subunit
VAIKGMHGTINPGAVVLVMVRLLLWPERWGNISSTFVAVDQHTTFLDDYFSFLSVEQLVPVPSKPQVIPEIAIDGIEFDDVTFTYPAALKPPFWD